MHIVFIEDNKSLATAVIKMLNDSGHAVDHFVDGSLANQHLKISDPDLAIIDINLPSLDGITLTKYIRQRKKVFPVILLTARDDIDDRVKGLDSGADDYLVKPFSMAELDARIRALSRRNIHLIPEIESIGLLSFANTARRLLKDLNEIKLSKRELTLFEALLQRKGQYVAKSILADKLYGTGSDISLNAIEVAVLRLRKCLSEFKITIKTGRGIGYMLDEII